MQGIRKLWENRSILKVATDFFKDIFASSSSKQPVCGLSLTLHSDCDSAELVNRGNESQWPGRKSQELLKYPRLNSWR